MDFLHISRGSGKLKGLDSLNTENTIIDFCKIMQYSKNKNIICVDCYAWRMLLTFRKNCIPKFRENTKKLKEILKIFKNSKYNDTKIII